MLRPYQRMDKHERLALYQKYLMYCDMIVSTEHTEEELHPIIKKVSNVYSSHIQHFNLNQFNS